MLPLLGIAVVGIAGVVGGASKLRNNHMKKKMSGKDIVALGLSGCGKTSLYHFLQHQEIAREISFVEHDSQNVSQKMPIQMNDRSIYMRDCEDLSGKEHNYEKWKERVKNADYILFLYDVQNLHNRVELESLNDIALQLSESVRKNKKAKICLIATHIDLLNAGVDIDGMVARHPFIRQVRYFLGGTERCKSYYSNLTDEKSVHSLMRNVFS